MSKTTGNAASKPPNRSGASSAVARARTERGPHRATLIGVTVIAIFAVVVLYLVYQGPPDKGDATAGGSGSAHVAGQPGIGATAPAFTLASNTGREISLADYRGKSVLLYFQEGLTCQPCWDQIERSGEQQAGTTESRHRRGRDDQLRPRGPDHPKDG